MKKLLWVIVPSILLGVATDVFALDLFNKEEEKAYNKGDFKTAYEKWIALAEKGDANAQLKLGVRYYEGNGVRKDYNEAIKWYNLAAEQGNTTAQINLGSMYHTGIGVPQNNVIAHKWFNLAGMNGDAAGDSLKTTTEREMTPQEVKEAEKLAKEWMRARKK